MATGVARPQKPTVQLRFRRSAARLTAGQLQLLRDGFQAMYGIADERGYAYHAGIHGLPLPIGCDNAHGTPYFLPWHRAYLYFFERALRDRVSNAGLVWWDWQTGPNRQSRLPGSYLRAKVDGKTNPLYSAPVLKIALEQGRQSGMSVGSKTRRETAGASGLPNTEDVEDVLSRPQFIDFSRA